MTRGKRKPGQDLGKVMPESQEEIKHAPTCVSSFPFWPVLYKPEGENGPVKRE